PVFGICYGFQAMAKALGVADVRTLAGELARGTVRTG
ncbi:hypothetical protein, partial [Streptomyces sp. NPDC048845]